MSPDLAKQTALSIPRMSSYLIANADQPSPLAGAIALYAWNAQVSAAFMYPLHFCEVLIRNAVSDVLMQTYGPQWPWEKGFFLSLPNVHKPYVFKPREAVLHARTKAEKSANAGPPSTDKAIAEMKFAFWESMFTARYDHALWANNLKALFPNAPRNMTYFNLRSEIHKSLENIRKLRNRIAHHEPIFSRALKKDYLNILKLVRYRCMTTSQWMDETQSVKKLLIIRP